MVQLPGLKRLQVFAKEFKSDFDCLQPPRTRPQFLITGGFASDALKDNQGSSTNVESSLTINTSNAVNVDTGSPQSIIEVHAQEDPASVTAHSNLNILVEDQAQEPESPASVTAASSNSSTRHVSFISQASGYAIDSCTTTAGVATLAVPYPSPPETEDGIVSDTSETEDDTPLDTSETEDGTVSDTTETEEDSKSTETAQAEDTVSDNDRRQRTKTYRFHNCRVVYFNSYNAHGVKVKNAGNNAPQVTCNSSSSSSDSSASSCHGELCPSCRYEVVPSPSDSTRYELPPMLPPLSFQESRDNLLYPPGIPVGIPGPNSDPFLNQSTVDSESPVDLPRQTSIPTRNSILPDTIDTTSPMQVNDDDDDANSSQHSPKMPGSKNLPGPYPKFPPLTINTSDHPIHTGFSLPPFPGSGTVQSALANIITADISSPRLSPHSPHYPVESLPASSPSRDSPDPDILLEHQLKCVLETIQKKLQTSSEEILSPRAQGFLIAVNSLVSSRTTPVSSRRSTRTLSCCESLYSHSCDSHSRPYGGHH